MTGFAPYYALAHNLKGFASSTLRVIVNEQRDGLAWIRTADLLDAGTPLTIDEAQIERIGEEVSA